MIVSNRLQASLLHLFISIFIAGLTLILVFFVWYPAPLHIAVGVTEIFLLLIAVDVVLGPLLTLVVFKREKKTLRFDLAVIALLQSAALAYGLYTVAIGRPTYIVFNKDRFDVVRAYEVDKTSQSIAKPPYDSAPWFGPQFVVAAIPKGDEKRREQILFSALQGGPDVPQLPDLYQSYESAEKELILLKAQSLENLALYNPATIALSDLQSRYSEKSVKFLPLRSNYADMVVIVNSADGQIVEIANLRPWT